MASAGTPSVRLSPRGRRAVRLTLFAAAVIGLLLGIDEFLLHVSSDPLNDAQAYYWAGGRLNAGLPLYPPDQSVATPLGYPYPPLLAILWRPLALLPWPVAAGLWEVLVLAAFGVTLWRLATGMLALPIVWCLVIGQVQVVLTMFTAFATPWSVALAANIKLFPSLIALWWVGRRDWRCLRRFIVSMAVLGVVQLVLAPQACLDYVTAISLKQVGEVRNISPYAVSPVLWAVLLVAGLLLVLRLARTRWGWAAAVALSVLANPRLLVYQVMTLMTVVTPADDAHGEGSATV
jgi:Glycosyltransferase family 87